VWSTETLWGTPFEQSCVEGDSVRWKVTVRGRGRLGRVDRGSAGYKERVCSKERQCMFESVQ